MAGSKPAALHTEYAEGESASGVAYGTQDIVFYLQRAGGDGGEDGPEEGGQAVPGDAYNGAGDDFDWMNEMDYVAGSEPDTRYDTSGMFEPLNAFPDKPSDGGQTSGGQIAAKSAAPPIFGNQGALLGTLTGHFETKDLEVGLGETTQNGGFIDSRDRLLLNAIGSVPNLERDLILTGTGASEKMFAGMYNKAFNPEENLEGTRTPEQIRKSLSRASSAELSVQLARATSGVRRVKDLVTLINSGDVGLTSQKTRAIQSRLSRRGQVRRRK